jgi:hypothetical protein
MSVNLYWCTGDSECWLVLAAYPFAAVEHSTFKRADAVKTISSTTRDITRIVGTGELAELGLHWMERRPDATDGTVPPGIAKDGEFAAVTIPFRRLRDLRGLGSYPEAPPRQVTFVRDHKFPYYRGVRLQWPALMRSSLPSMLDVTWFEGNGFDDEDPVADRPVATGRGATFEQAIDELLAEVDCWIDDREVE